MFIQYNNLDMNFTIGSTRFRTLNIAYEHLPRIIPSHSHGDNSYEIHYVASGRGYITVGEKTYEITPNTLYMAGPPRGPCPDFRTGRSHGGLLYLPEAAPHFIRREKNR